MKITTLKSDFVIFMPRRKTEIIKPEKAKTKKTTKKPRKGKIELNVRVFKEPPMKAHLEPEIEYHRPDQTELKTQDTPKKIYYNRAYEERKKIYVWTVVTIMVSAIIFLWGFNMKAEIRRLQQEGESKREFQEMQSELSETMSKIRASMDDMRSFKESMDKREAVAASSTDNIATSSASSVLINDLKEMLAGRLATSTATSAPTVK